MVCKYLKLCSVELKFLYLNDYNARLRSVCYCGQKSMTNADARKVGICYGSEIINC